MSNNTQPLSDVRDGVVREMYNKTAGTTVQVLITTKMNRKRLLTGKRYE